MCVRLTMALCVGREANCAGRALPIESKGLVLRHLPSATYLTAAKDKLLVQPRVLHRGANWSYVSKPLEVCHSIAMQAHLSLLADAVRVLAPASCACLLCLFATVRECADDVSAAGKYARTARPCFHHSHDRHGHAPIPRAKSNSKQVGFPDLCNHLPRKNAFV